MSNDLVQRLREYAEWHTNVTNAEQRVPFGEPPLNVGDHIAWKAADRIEELEAALRSIENHPNIDALGSWQVRDTARLALEGK